MRAKERPSSDNVADGGPKCQRGSLKWRGKNHRLWDHIDLPLVNWLTLGKSLFHLDPEANIISSDPAKPSPIYSEGKKNSFIQPMFLEHFLMSGTGT